MNNPICFYHRADLDGICSGTIVHKAIPTCELYGFDYADLFPWDKVQGRDVIMVDVSLPYADMKRLKLEAKSLVWIDHHKTALDELADLHLQGNSRSGTPSESKPLVSYVGSGSSPTTLFQ